MPETKIMIHDKEELDATTVYKDHHTAVRGVLLNNADKVLIECLKKFDLYTLPGGFLENDEGPEEAFKREVLEETGYSCEIIHQLTTIEEYRQKQQYHKTNYIFVARIIGPRQQQSLDKEETLNELSIAWHPFPAAVRLLMTQKPQTEQQSFLIARDQAVINEAYFRLLANGFVG